jgi:lipopolysaccharide transport system permease protein
MPFSAEVYSWHILWLFPVVILQFAFISGISFYTSATMVFIRDVGQLISSLLLLIMFFTPIFYTREMMPAIVQKITFFNPFYQITNGYRSCLLYHKIPSLLGLTYLGLLDILLWYTGLKFFRRLKGYFEACL